MSQLSFLYSSLKSLPHEPKPSLLGIKESGDEFSDDATYVL